ncbi:TerB family tellurite resistance protein [Candidatus Pelagibacter sp. Uisw_134_02]|uniref:tellurite resistance TerB family protein n=1 Tax=Candidatus Pelagibacter sp. Uisw_134_02 TaxID=3230990 RepID=UPI0039EA250F
MIIFGTKGRSIKMDSGKFHCPNCNTPRTYQKKYVQDWFTLYFIPTFPVGGKKNEHIECEECSSIYHLDVIDHKPGLNDEEMASEYEKALQNVLCLMIIADNKVEDEEVKTVSDIFNKLTNDKKLSKAKITKTITKLKKDDLTVDEYLKEIRPYLNAEHRELIIKAMYLVAGSDGHLDDKESELLMYTAKVLEMTPAHIKGVLSELDKGSLN